MADGAEDVRLGASKYPDLPLGTLPKVSSYSGRERDYTVPDSVALFEIAELRTWSLWRAAIAEFMATLIFLYVSIGAVIGHLHQEDLRPGSGVGLQAIAWVFGGAIFVLVYATAGISGGHLNPAVTFAFLLSRKVSLARFLIYAVAQCLGAIVGVGFVRGWQTAFFDRYGIGAANTVHHGYTTGTGLGAEIIGTFILVHTVFSVTDAKRNARDSHVPILAPLPIGFVVFVLILCTISITGTGINPARSFAVAVILNQAKAWDDHWIFWVGPFIGAGLATAYYDIVIVARPFRQSGSGSGSLNPI